MTTARTFRTVYFVIFVLILCVAIAAQLDSISGAAAASLNVEQSKITASFERGLASSTISDISFAPDTPHTLVGSYYTVQNGFKAKLLLNNKGIEPLEVRPKLYSLSGRPTELEPAIVEPQSALFIDLQDWVNIAGPDFHSGSIELFHTGLDLVLSAQIYLTDDEHSLSFEEKLAEMGKFNSQKQEAMFYQPSDHTETKIVLSNKYAFPLTVTGKLSKAPRRVGDTQTFQLAAFETKVLGLKDDFSDGQQFAGSDVVGLSIEHGGAADALQARVLIYDRALGYSNLAQFSNPNGGKSSEYQGVGFQIEDIEGVKLDPVIVVRNVGDQNSTVTAKIPYTKTNGSTGVINLPQVTLRPAEMKRLDVQQIKQRVAQQSIQAASLELSYTTSPGSVIAAAHSQSEDRNQVFRVPMWDPFAQKSPTGGYPWRIENTSTTKTYIKNITARAVLCRVFDVGERRTIYDRDEGDRSASDDRDRR